MPVEHGLKAGMLLVQKVEEEWIILLLCIFDGTLNGGNDANNLTRNG